MTAHALLSASSAHRWLACPPSARLEEQFPDTSSEAAAEGTLAHAIAAERLEHYILTGKPCKTSDALKSNPLFRPVMEDYVDDFVGYVINLRETLRQKDPFTVIYIEKRVDFSHFVPEGFGTADVILIGDGILQIVDFKYGKGVLVEATDNPQMRLYALGAVRNFPGTQIDLVEATIHQPRLSNISTEALSVNSLLAWAVDYVQPRAILASKGEGEFLAGDHCRFCRASATCAARAKYQLELTKYEFRDAALLSPDEIGEILAQVDDLTRWAKSVKDYAMQQALEMGETFAGWKLVEGRSNRVILNAPAALQKLIAAGFGYDQVVDLVGLTRLEEIVGRKHLQDLIGDHIAKPAGKPTLVRDTDKRPEFARAAEDFKE